MLNPMKPPFLSQRSSRRLGQLLLVGGLCIGAGGSVGLAQPTGRKIDQQTTADSLTRRDSVGRERTRIEADYLARARAGIEQHRKGDARLRVVDGAGKPLRNVSVTVNQVTQDFLFGNLLFELVQFGKKPTNESLYKERFKALFNFGVLPFYWANYERQPGQPDWKRNEAVIDWCRQNGITLKGHPLGWTSPSGTPGWLLRLPPATAEATYKARIISNVVGYKGRVDIWDVVNEPVNTVPWETALRDTANTNDFRYDVDSVSVASIVPWVERSFKWAEEASPGGDYILNEYFTLAIPRVRDRFFTLLTELRQRNTPVRGIGIQGHEPREWWFSPVEVYKTLDLYAQFGVPIHITELIPQSSGKAIKGWRSGIWTEAAQAEFAEQIYTLAFGHPAVASINWWGLSDQSIWLKGGGLLDADYNPKPVYTALLKLIKEDWMTKNVSLSTGKAGTTTFRGFYGQYDIVVTKPDGTRQTQRVHLREKGDNQWTVTL